MNKVSYYLVITVGIITCLSFFPHAFLGMQKVMEHIEKGEIQEPAANGMRMIWLYSSVMMLISGIWLLISANHILIGSHKARLQVLVLGIGLAVFGLGCSYISRKFDPMLVFTIEGVLLIIATTFTYKKAHHLYEHNPTEI
jgi:cytochrome bd-type quinol oxidase subunit 2